MNTIDLALRNLLRNRRRSLATLLAMVIGLCATLLFGGYAGNTMYAMETGYVQLHGHLQLQRRDYFLYGSGNPAAYGIADYPRLIEQIRRDPVLAPLLTMVTPKLQLGGIAGHFSAALSTNVASVGVIAPEQAVLRQWDDYGAASYTPPMSLLGTPADSVVIGTGVARKLQLCQALGVQPCPAPARVAPAASGPALPEDLAALSAQEARPAAASDVNHATRIEMLAATVQGAPNVVDLNVVKAENFGLKEFDDSFTILHLAQAQRLVYGAAEAQVTAIQLQLHHTAQMPAARARLQQLLDGEWQGRDLAVVDFQTLAPVYGQTIEFFDSVFGFMATLIGVIVLFTVGNTMSMAVLERTTEIGTLRAIGQRQSGIRRLFVAEGLLLGLAGTVLGTLAALGWGWLINRSGLTWTPPGYVYAYPLQVRVWGAWSMLAGSAAGLVAVAGLSAWWPARRAARLQIVDALRHA
ncbi:ABC transporter permease [Sphaerotilus microaerophilus]|uniref:ABC transporter permease n=1 Tax=Sphaerotilus microaerophilus TaxID=2914710 RepID=A0ABM7YQS5_9BURK|nr:FtsX-like permease family protein [Sphaerotilus sp. FB-5]BDI06913.1 ABC transporter permease [Sphaerotilus sp. FB-5]